MRTLAMLLALASAASAQFDSNVITVTASRQLNSQPDQVSVGVTVTTDEKQTLDTVLASLPQNITAANLSAVSGYGTGQVQWIFILTVPIPNLTDTIVSLHAAAARRVFPIDYYVQGSTMSAQATDAQQCPYPALISDARAQAAKLAAAAGVTLGPIVTLEQGTRQPAAVRSGDFSYLLGAPVGSFISGSFVSSLVTSPIPSCSLTVQFKIGQ